MYTKLAKNSKLFTILVIISILMISLLLVLFSLFITSDYYRIYRELLTFIIYFLFLLLSFIIIGIIMMLMSQANKKTHTLFLNWMKLSFKLLYPVIYALGNFMGIEKDQLRGQYAQINNYLVSKDRIKVHAKDLLLLAPQCIQRTECPYKITSNISHCKKCGKCSVKDLINISDKYGIQLSIVTGGTSARNVIFKNKPRGIVAIACERDLTSGMHDIKVIPVIGVINERPEGPCHNTVVNINRVENAILYFLEGGDL